MCAAKDNGMDMLLGGKEQIKKAKRSKIVLILVIIVMLAALGTLGYVGYNYYLDNKDEFHPSEGSNVFAPPSSTNIAPGEVNDIPVPGKVEYQTTQIPNLTQLFGLTVEEVSAHLGSEFLLKMSEPIPDSENASITQLATFDYTPVLTEGSKSESTTASQPVQSIYASLNAEGRVVEILYLCDLRLLGYPEKSFSEMLDDESLVTSSLTAAGTQARDLTAGEQNTVYDNPASANRKITVQTALYSGRTTADTNPTAWTLRLKYDYGSAGVTTASDFRQAVRTINLTLR